ncbi:hypothetical protein [Ancylobacter lacus]|uniref:hypothetical protein n=1 Tax=Ancylobacter lacus TaxID=2579970 RepID=UPI001BCFB972|nr:hypothetical protein [Ancylobacter lacus]MBS7539353.1 hypothetical protein [Ancylobacter lacus]
MPHTSPSARWTALRAARDAGQDTRPALLRLLARRFVEEAPRDAAGRERFARLMLRLVPAADAASLAEAVAVLAPRRDLPQEVALALARAPIEISEPMLRLSPVLGESHLRALAESGSPAHAAAIAAAIAARRDVPASLARHLAETLHQARSEAGTEPARLHAPAAEAEPPRPARYLAAGPAERAAILDHLVRLPPLPMTERVPHLGSALLERLRQSLDEGRAEEVTTLLSLALRAPRPVAQEIAADRTGEALVVAARALGLPFELASRLVFLLHPQLVPSAERVRALAELHETLPDGHAQHIAATWRESRRARPAAEAPSTAPSMRGFGEPRRAADTTPAAERTRRLG